MNTPGLIENCPRVLVVDDERANLAVLALTLRNEGYEVQTSNSGEDALEKTQTQIPDLILLDIMMPGIDGFQTIRSLKSRSTTAAVPVIFLSGMEDLDSKLKGFALGAVDYVVKPFHVEEVRARVRLHLQLAQATKALLSEQSRRLRQLEEAQKDLLVSPLDVPEAKFSVLFRPHEEAGGDLYDVLQASTGIHGYLVADVAGHDVGSSLVASAARALLRQNAGPMYSPEQTFRLVNDVLSGWLPPGKYLTANYARLNRRTNTLSVVSAAHPPALFLPKGRPPETLDAPGDVLGAFKGALFGTAMRKVSAGDRVVLYTDGLIEDPAVGRPWSAGLGLLREAASEIQEVSLEDLPGALVERLVPAACSDDLLVLAFEV